MAVRRNSKQMPCCGRSVQLFVFIRVQSFGDRLSCENGACRDLLRMDSSMKRTHPAAFRKASLPLRDTSSVARAEV